MRAMKVIVMVPKKHADRVRTAIGEAGGGKIGNYSHSSWSVLGTGRFKPEKGANPTIGRVGKLEKVSEERIEFICEKKNLKKVIAAIKKVHPYETPAIDAFPVEIF